MKLPQINNILKAGHYARSCGHVTVAVFKQGPINKGGVPFTNFPGRAYLS